MCSKAFGVRNLVYVWLETSLQPCASISLSEESKKQNNNLIYSIAIKWWLNKLITSNCAWFWTCLLSLIIQALGLVQDETVSYPLTD